jgi:hypothetical protein
MDSECRLNRRIRGRAAFTLPGFIVTSGLLPNAYMIIKNVNDALGKRADLVLCGLQRFYSDRVDCCARPWIAWKARARNLCID